MMFYTFSMFLDGCASPYCEAKRSGTLVVELTTTRSGDIGPFLELFTSSRLSWDWGWSIF